MPYPSSVDAGQVVPFALYDGEIASNSAAALVANTCYLVGVTLNAYATLTSMRVDFGTGGNGHYDLGVYDATGANGAPINLLAHCAATNTTLATATGLVTGTFISSVALAPGRYWLALWIDNATDTVTKSNSHNNQSVSQSGTNAGPLPALASSIAGLANNAVKPVLLGLFSGGWS